MVSCHLPSELGFIVFDLDLPATAVLLSGRLVAVVVIVFVEAFSLLQVGVLEGDRLA